MVAAPSTRPDEPLVPPAVCCGREFRVRRALEAHERSHGACGEAGCTFAGSCAVLRLHAWEAHGIGSAPKTAPVRGGSTLHDELCAGRAGNEFRIVDELAAEAVPLEVRFPGADIVWMHDDAAEAGALGPAEDGADDEWPREADGHSPAVLPWPDGCPAGIPMRRHALTYSRMRPRRRPRPPRTDVSDSQCESERKQRQT